jgi:hypothetical protein
VRLEPRYGKAIWHMLTNNQPFAPAGAGFLRAARRQLAGLFSVLPTKDAYWKRRRQQRRRSAVTGPPVRGTFV